MKPVTSWERVPLVFSLAYAACLLDMYPENLRIMAKSGKFPAFKAGKNWKVEKEKMRAWLDQQHSAERAGEKIAV